MTALVVGMVTGADSIDDMARLRHGAMGRLFDRAYAPSTLGSFLRAFTFSHGRQLRWCSADRVLLDNAGHEDAVGPRCDVSGAPGLPRRRRRGRAGEVGVRAGVEYERVAVCRRSRGHDAVDGLIDSKSPATSPWGQPLRRLTAPGQPDLGMLHACLTPATPTMRPGPSRPPRRLRRPLAIP